MENLEILYEQGPVLAINKPPGLATQSPPEFDSLELQVRALLKQRENKPGNIYLGVPHRLDRCASGVIVFARHVRAARRISQQFEHRSVRKLYWACVEGEVTPAAGTWRDHLIKVYGHPQAEVVDATHPLARPAVLHYRTIGHTPYGSWLEIELETGRTHQVRIQAASRGHPVLGDVFYGARIPFGEQFEDERLRAIALHARLLEFQHPMTRKTVEIIAPPPAVWEKTDLTRLDP
jgi:23S rRNA pseudouridine1911/1915/1917 synthase